MTLKSFRDYALHLGAALLVTALAVLLVACVSVPYGRADGLPKTSKIADSWAPLVTTEAGWKAHNWLIGVMGNHTWRPDLQGEGSPLADEWQLGLLAGYLYRSGATGWAGGVDVEWTPNTWDRLRDDDGTLMVRARAGAFVTSKTFVYGILGGALQMDALDGILMKGPVVGAGVEVDIATGFALRAEVLHQRYGSDYLDWGEDGATVAKFGAVMKF